MNFKHIFHEIEKIDPEIYDRLDSRRDVIKNYSKIGGRIALTALPLALGGLLKKAYGGPPPASLVDVLNYALTLEYLESEFYIKAVATAGLITDDGAKSAITTIRDHEVAHVTDLKAVITGGGGTPATKPTFDFTAGGAFANVFSNYDTFLAVAQTFEDTGVRAYKGQANNANLMANDQALTAALKIHSVEARHAAHIRYMRRLKANNTAIKPWITGKDTAGIGASVQASYDGEENGTQADVNIATTANVSANAATEAFDEPLSMEQVLGIATLFIV